ncbi:MAG: sigma-54-dependent transcriptional regulator [Syntrophales bacterium]
MAKILIIDDDEMYCDLVSRELKYIGHDSTIVLTLKEGIYLASSEEFDVVLLDVILPDGNGLEMLPAFRQAPSSPEVIIITGMGSADGAELAIRSGAWDYIEKPSSLSMMILPVIRALEYREAKNGDKNTPPLDLEGIMGSSTKTKACFDLLAQAAAVDSNVLITGETGTGKELFAKSIHRNGKRAKRNFVIVDCAALQENLADSILFGHEKGAFTGADRARDGLVRQADGGTLFLDEVGELPLTLQKNFLRVLQERKFRPLGGAKDVESDFRLIAATNRDLNAMVKSGQFRSDLLYRLRSLHIEIPPLRERPEDIGEIVTYHIARICGLNGIPVKGLSPEFFEALCFYRWPGNIRELVNTLERSIAASLDEPKLFLKHLPDSIRVELARKKAEKPDEEEIIPRTSFTGSVLPKLKDVKKEANRRLEIQYLTELMSVTEGDIPKAIRISGLGRTRLYNLLKKHGISTGRNQGWRLECKDRF